MLSRVAMATQCLLLSLHLGTWAHADDSELAFQERFLHLSL